MKTVTRFEDMSQRGRLTLTRQDDGDIIVGIIPDSEKLLQSRNVEFCTHGGGGQSQNTLRALYALMEAIELDNQEYTQQRD